MRPEDALLESRETVPSPPPIAEEFDGCKDRVADIDGAIVGMLDSMASAVRVPDWVTLVIALPVAGAEELDVIVALSLAVRDALAVPLVVPEGSGVFKKEEVLEVVCDGVSDIDSEAVGVSVGVELLVGEADTLSVKLLVSLGEGEGVFVDDEVMVTLPLGDWEGVGEGKEGDTVGEGVMRADSVADGVRVGEAVQEGVVVPEVVVEAVQEGDCVPEAVMVALPLVEGEGDGVVVGEKGAKATREPIPVIPKSLPLANARAKTDPKWALVPIPKVVAPGEPASVST